MPMALITVVSVRSSRLFQMLRTDAALSDNLS